MAYGKKYFVEYKSSNNLDYYCEIWVEGQTAAAIQIEIGEGGPVIEYDTDKNDRFSPIISSSCRFPFLVKNFLFAQFIDNLRTLYKEKDVYLHLYRSPQSGHNLVAPLWSGFLLMDLSAGVDQSYPYVQELKFIDGLSLLKDVDFVKYPSGSPSGGGIPFEERTQGNYVRENMYYGPGTYIFWIREILQKVGSALTTNGASQNYGFTTSVNWYNQENNSLSQSSDPLHLTKCQMTLFHSKDDQGTFYPDNCYNVLKNILKHWGARITYWKHEFWIVQIPEYITNESGTLDAPVNLNSRLYSNTGAFNGSQGHLGGTYWTRYEQEISTNTISKLVGTEYNYIAPIKKVTADFLSFSSKSIYGGFPFGSTAPTQEIFQGSLNGPSNADFVWLSIPLDFVWDMTNSPLSAHTGGWWLAVKFNFYASNIDDQTGVITTYYLQYTSSSNTYYWVTEANWTPLGNKSPKYIIKSKSLSETNYVGFEQQIPFNDVNGASIVMDGLWSFFLDIEDFGTSNNNPGSFYCNFSGYNNPPKMRNPQNSITLPGNISSGTVTWSNTLEDQQGVTTININNPNPAGFNAGTSVDDYSLSTTSPFKGLLQLLSSTSSTAFGDSINLIIDNSNNSEEHSFGQLVWGDTISYAQSSLESYNGTIYVPTDSNGQWGRGILTGTSTFTEMLINEFLSGQTKVVINSSFRLAVGDSNKTQTVGLVSRPRYVNPIGKLRETTAPGADPEYFFRRGKFYTALDEWDYEGYQIIRNSFVSTSNTNNIGNLGGSQLNLSSSSAPSQNPALNALSQNSPIAYISQTVASTGANVSVNGNFNTAVGWSLGTGWSIDTTVNKAKFTATGSTSELTQSVLTEELTYQINFTVEVTAGSLLVKAGSSGTTETITSSGNYSIYLDCEGSSLIKFQASTTFTGNITHITIADQKSLSSVPIETIGTSVFKIGDTFNLINSNDSDTLNLTVTANQGSNDSTISVASTPLYEDIDTGSFLLINQDDLSEQYQNKTKGTVAGFGIDADGISKGGIEITGWLNSDTMSGAAVTNVPTALSVKNYVDAQVGSVDTLEEVTANGNSTSYGIEFTSTNFSIGQAKIGLYSNDYLYLRGGANGLIISGANGAANFRLTDSYSMWEIGSTEKMRLTSTGLGIGTTSPSATLHVIGNAGSTTTIEGSTQSTLNLKTTSGSKNNFIVGTTAGDLSFRPNGVTSTTLKASGNLLLGTTVDGGAKLSINQSSTTNPVLRLTDAGVANYDFIFPDTNTIKLETNTSSTKTFKLLNAGSGGFNLEASQATFSGQVTIPATPVATTDAASKSYVDAQVGTADTLSEVLALGNTSGANDIEMALGQKVYFNNNNENIFSNVNGDLQINARTELRIKGNNNNTNGVELSFFNGGSEKMRLLNNGNVLIGTTTDSGEVLSIFKSGTAMVKLDSGATFPYKAGVEFLRSSINGGSIYNDGSAVQIKLESYYNYESAVPSRGGFMFKTAPVTSGTLVDAVRIDARGFVGVLNSNPTEALHVVGKGIFTDQVTIPATPVATTDAASKSYVDAQVGTADTLSEVLALGNTSGANDIIMNNNQSYKGTHTNGANYGLLTLTSGNVIKLGAYEYTSAAVVIGGGDHAQFHIGASEKMRLTSGGNLLIGGTSDTDKLVVEDATAPNIRMYRSGIGQVWQQTIDSSGRYMLREAASAGGTKYVRLQIDDTGEVEVFNTLTGTSATFSGTSNGFITLNSTDNGSSFMALQRSGTRISYIGYGDNSNNLSFANETASGHTLFLTNSTERARITSGGNLLIGTTTDSGFKFNVETTGVAASIKSTASELPLIIFSEISSNRAMISFKGKNTTNDFNIRIGAELQDFIVYTNNTERARITSGGNLLIGTTTDSGAKLNVYKNNNVPLQVFGWSDRIGAANNANGSIYIGNNASYRGVIDYDASSTVNLIISNTYDNAAAGILFKTKTSGTGNDVMMLSGDGNVGIGTTSPVKKLHLKGTGTVGMILESTDNGQNLDIDYYNNVGSVQGRIRYAEGTGDFDFMPNSSSVSARITYGGNLLIGTTTDSGYKLDINGTTRITGELRLASNINQYSGDFSVWITNVGQAFTIKPNTGNVGIGTSSPAKKLHINGDIKVDNGSILVPQAYGINFGQSGYDILMPSSTRIAIKTAGTEKLSVLNNGNVLIGTTTDSGEKLQILGSTKLEQTTNTNVEIKLNPYSSVLGTSYAWNLVASNSANSYGFDIKQGTTSILHINNSAAGNNNITLSSALTGTTGQFTGIGVATSPSAVYKLDVNGKARVQSVLELDDVLTLNAISTPADPASGKSSIYMDSADGAIKVKINVGGTVVTRTIASFE